MRASAQNLTRIVTVLLTVLSLLLQSGHVPAARAIDDTSSVEPCALNVRKFNTATEPNSGYWTVVGVFSDNNLPCDYEFAIYYSGGFDAFGIEAFTCDIDQQALWTCKGRLTKPGQVLGGVNLNDAPYPQIARYYMHDRVDEWQFYGHASFLPISIH